MRKSENPNSINMKPAGSMRKLGFFFLWVFVLFSNPVLAIEETGSGEIVDSVRNDKKAQAEVNVLYIEKGAFVYGMENITQTYATSPDTQKSVSKATPKKKKQVVKKKTVKQKAEQQLPKPTISVVLSSHPSEESFSISKKSSAVATITLNQTLKSAVQAGFSAMQPVPFSNTNSLYTHKLFWKEDVSGSSILTRPPPFRVSISA